MTTADGVEFVRTPDSCFEDLPDWDYEPKYVEIDGLRQAYVDVGTGESGETSLLLHGQPAWSYLSRKMIPVLAAEGHRVIAMDHVPTSRLTPSTTATRTTTSAWRRSSRRWSWMTPTSRPSCRTGAA